MCAHLTHDMYTKGFFSVRIDDSVILETMKVIFKTFGGINSHRVFKQ